MKIESHPLVLVVDDDAISLKIACRMLEKLGISTVAVASGADAIALLKSKKFDAIILDCIMPHLDGQEVTRRIRSLDNQVAKTPIIAMSARNFDEFRESCLSAGMDDFLAKPLRLFSLATTLQKWIKHLSLDLVAAPMITD